MTFGGNDREIMTFLTDLRNRFIEVCFSTRGQEKSKGKIPAPLRLIVAPAPKTDPKTISKPIHTSLFANMINTTARQNAVPNIITV